MSAALTGFRPARPLPNGQLFYSPIGLYEFQIDGIAEIYVRTEQHDGGMLAVWDTGIGKTVLGIADTAFMFTDGLIDLAIVVCEKNKRIDWRDEFEKFTALDTLLYHGSGRQQRLAKHGVPHVLVTTYETARVDLLQRVKTEGKRGRGRAADGPLFDALSLRGKRILWIFDEVPKVRNRSSEVHKAMDYALTQLRRTAHQRVIGLTGTPIERGYEDAYNIGRILFPSRMPSVGEFKKIFINGQDRYGHDLFDDRQAERFARMFAKCMVRKRKTDPDVIDQFPKMIEESAVVELNADEREFLRVVEDETWAHYRYGPYNDEVAEDIATNQVWQMSRMTVGHPASHLHTTNEVSRKIVAALGADALRSIGSSKTRHLIEYLTPLVKGQGAQVVLFSFFTSVLREVARELRDAGFVLATHHGGQADDENEEAKRAFKAGEVEILFTSDIGTKGLNLQEATYVVEYESALTYANRLQRLNRAHRITSDKPSVTCVTLVAHDTVEENIFARTIDRNEQQDTLLGDVEDGTEFISASTRREMLAAHHRSWKK